MREVLPYVDLAPFAIAENGSLRLGTDGTPSQPLVFVDLTRPVTADAQQVVSAVERSLSLVVGVADGAIHPTALPVVDALAFSLVGDVDAANCTCLWASDVHGAATSVAGAAAARPRASVVLGQVLRQAAELPVRQALAGEAAAYSMLLSGPELAAWLAGRARRPIDASGSRVAMQRDGDVLRLVLDRAGRRNAFDAAMREALLEALGVAFADPVVQVELSGRGPDFCSGGDLDEFGTATDIGAAYLVRLERHPGWLVHLLQDRTHVRLHGACIGAGIELPAFAGHVTADTSASFSLPEVAMGLIPGAGGTASITRRIGRWRTAWMALTGAKIDAATALDWGLVDAVETW